MYRAILYNPQLEIAVEVMIDEDNEYENLSTVLKCEEIDMMSHPSGYGIAIDGTAFFKKNNVLTRYEGVEQPLAGNILFIGMLDEEGYATSLDANVTPEYIEQKFTYYATISDLKSK